MINWNDVSAFMANVVVWPGSQKDPGYINLHYSYVDKANPAGPLKKNGGSPYRSLDKLVEQAAWINTSANNKDVWYCMSLQAETKPNKKYPARPFAHRLAKNALAVKALWIDLDVVDPANPGPTDKNKYPTLADALTAVMKFQIENNLPPFSALVASGNGLHAYWISKAPLTPQEWRGYAEGLKVLILNSGLMCDAGLTTDIVRLLRVPGTFNHKDRANRKPVLLLNVPLVMYDFQATLQFLVDLAPAGSTTVQVDKSEHPLFAEGAQLDSFKQKPILAASPDDTLQGGIDKFSDNSADVEAVFKQCGFYQHALLTGGADYDNALWMYSVLGATFMGDRGNAIAHAVSKGHPSYTPPDTQALYDRKLAERADGRVGGPPTCGTIKGAGCKSCSTCPLFAEGKSPVNIRPVVTATVTPLNMAPPPPQTAGARLLSLPDGYDLNDDGYICEVEEQNASGGDPAPPKLHQLFLSKLTEPYCQSEPDTINFTTTVDGNRTWDASIRHDEMGGMGLDRVFGKNHVKIFPRNKSRLEHFIVSWLAKLHRLGVAQQALPFGWYKEANNIRGFVYGGKIMRDDNTEVPCGSGDPKLRQIFHPTPHGVEQHWLDACKTITGQKRPELDAIMAVAFSAPLTALVGQNAMTLCAYGESGAGKTAAYTVGISVWGHPIKGKAVSHSTFNSVMRKMGELTNLPLYWDEIKDPKAQAAVYDFIYTASDGTEKDRMKDGRDMQDKGSWQTQMCMAANISFTDFVMKKDTTHVAGVSRVLEYFVKKVTNGPGRISPTDASVIFDKLKTSYGMMGMKYARLLALNHQAITDEAVATCRQVEVDMLAQPEERLWVSLVGTLLVGARLANTLGCDFDLPALKTFLYATYLANRSKRDTLAAIAGSRDTTEQLMTSYFDQVNSNDQAIWTSGMPIEKGKPMAVTLLHGVSDNRNTQLTTKVAMRWDVLSQSLFISKDHFVKFCQERELALGTTLVSLEKEFGMQFRQKTTLGAGTSYVTGRSTVMVFSAIDVAHPWAQQMYKYTKAEEVPKAGAVERVDTGFEIDENGLATAVSVNAFVKGATAGAAQ